MTASGRALMAGLIDYAGLFPPADLDMISAVRHYREHLVGPEKWAMGRFVVPTSRLREFKAAFEGVCCAEHESIWSLSMLSQGDPNSDSTAIDELVQGAVTVESIELKAASQAAAEQFLANWTATQTSIPVYVEFPPAEAKSVLPILASAGARAKLRTGGLVADAFPSPETVADFLLACAQAYVPFKATAGLHHAVRGEYKLTYDPHSAQATMHGFANVFLAALLARRNAEKQALIDTLEAQKFSFTDQGVRWLGLEAGTEEIAATRREFAISYGSCSFAEPIEEARKLGWIECKVG